MFVNLLHELSLLALLLPLIAASPSLSLESIRAIIRAQPLTPDVNVTTWVAISRGTLRAGDNGNRNPERPGPPGSPKGQHGLVRGRKRSSFSQLHSSQLGQTWHTPIQVGGHTYQVSVDTGSSDTWLVTPNFTCVAENGTSVPQAHCKFGPAYYPGSELKPIQGVNFDINYGDGLALRGRFGIAKVTVGGITVSQQLGLVDYAFWEGDGVSSGMMGLSYPSIVYAFSGNNYSANTGGNQVPYNPLFTTMYKEHKIPPIFSMAVERPGASSNSNKKPDGYLAFGGLAPVSTIGKWATAEIEYPSGDDYHTPGTLPQPQYEAYSFSADAFLYSTTPAHLPAVWKRLNTTAASLSSSAELSASAAPKVNFRTMVDSGATQSWLPTILANHIASLYSPPGIYNPSGDSSTSPDYLKGLYSIPCDALIPRLAVQIGGVILPWDKRDLIMPAYFGPGCVTGIGNGKTFAPFKLGDTFMRSNLVVFDAGKGEIRMKSRGVY
ncbi:related to acid proteinase [Rhynchosporium agropyri]|uniref:Related to acid proteinase n=1 Tax=Rhynchosporium agropyri TaxID=914238 RepID=A0A1E1K4H9_9HELO|nr:related to acid proteinase [Rhynchosporium agropyri]